MSWYAIRTLYMWEPKSDGTNVFEERVVAFQADSDDEVFKLAQEEAEVYSLQEDGNYEIHPQQMSYRLDEGELIDGHEIWSQLFQANESLDEFYQNRYARYEYHPE